MRSWNTSTRLIPGAARRCSRATPDARAIVRRLILEVDNYFDKATDPLLDQAFWKKPEERDAQKIAEARKGVVDELVMFTKAMRGDYLAGPLSAADFAFYPLVAFLYRAQKMKLPDLDADGMLTPQLRAWKARIEALPFFDKTVPPHWKAAVGIAGGCHAADDHGLCGRTAHSCGVRFLRDRSADARADVRQPESGLRLERSATSDKIARA